jgi:DNA-binding FrmR family transcriptional regulator
VQAVERCIESEADCDKVLHLVAATRGALNGLMDEIIEEHAWAHVAAPELSDAEREQGVTVLIEAIRRYAK